MLSNLLFCINIKFFSVHCYIIDIIKSRVVKASEDHSRGENHKSDQHIDRHAYKIHRNKTSGHSITDLEG